jgi:hypothetical protein
MVTLNYAAQADFELVILLPEPPKCWDYMYVQPSALKFIFISHY